VDLGDVDGDLDLDIVTSNFSGANFTLYENDGTGVFINRNDLPSNQAGSCAVFHDRDNDGDMDMTGIDELQDLLILFTNEPVTLVNDDRSSPEDFILFQNYPNPFNPTTNIKFTIPISPLNPSIYQGEGDRERLITLKVYDVLGNEITTLVNEFMSPGTYEVEFSAKGGSAPDGNAYNLPSGIYFYTLTSGNPSTSSGQVFSETKKMILLK
jgi:hypothetical protein